MDKYDSTADVMRHKAVVRDNLDEFVRALRIRAVLHDNSKLTSPEKEMFDQWTPELKHRTFGTDYYKEALDAMGDGIKHHYQQNRHHPEHFENGVDGMNLFDVVEMVCDWMAAAKGKGVAMDLEFAAKRFHLTPQLASIIGNTIEAMREIDTVTVQVTA